ncbi:ABC transporter substrate-binding protein [Baaleninema simplex]|uniref:ABC transporter substrate-binding protein n=1 Tax=Baaleninema simplex TaxID=2862350 RepID=UPI00034CB74B|nr:spermidine/putrescine ABC transporter substrate-binding protein [Baaleninema simplex]
MPSTRLSFSGGHSTRRQFLKASAAAASGLALSSCGWTLANVRTNVRTASDVLYIYTWAGYTDRELIDQFYKETQIRVIADVFSSNEEMLAKVQAGAGGAYSVIYPSDYMVRRQIDLNMLMELDKSRLPGLDRLFPKFRDPSYDRDNRYSVPLSWGTTGLIYNRKALNPPPTDWQYLWDYQQQLTKRLTLLNDQREVFGAVLRSLGYSYNSTNPDEIRAAYEKLVRLKPAIAAFNSDAWRTQILTGDLKIAMCYSSDANEITPENTDLAYVHPESGSSIWTDALVIPRTAPNIEGAYAWLEFMLRPEVAARICERLSFATPNATAFELLPREVQTNTTLFPPESAIEKSESLEPIPPDVGEIYNRYWTKLTSG